MMCVMLSLITAKSDYIYKANMAYENLNEASELFRQEAYVMNRFKCMLAREEDIDDFVVNGIYVNVYQNNNGYDLYFDSYHINTVVYDKQIVSFEVNR